MASRGQSLRLRTEKAVQHQVVSGFVCCEHSESSLKAESICPSTQSQQRQMTSAHSSNKNRCLQHNLHKESEPPHGKCIRELERGRETKIERENEISNGVKVSVRLVIELPDWPESNNESQSSTSVFNLTSSVHRLSEKLK